MSAEVLAGAASPSLTYSVRHCRWRVEAEFVVRDGLGHIIHIPAGFECDLASVPRPAWLVTSPVDLSTTAAVVHDFMYCHGGQLPPGSVVPHRDYTRAEADRLFREIMRSEGVAWWRAAIAYTAVRAAGWAHWQGRK